MEGKESGWVKLYHPRGPQVTIPVPPAPASAMLEFVSGFLDAGWLVSCPDAVPGETKEAISHVLRTDVRNSDQTVTPRIFLYSTNQSLAYPIVSCYLNNADLVANFEYATGLKVSELPKYIGRDHPKRGSSPDIDALIIPTRRPCEAVMVPNPRHDPNETDPAKKKPARLLKRWTPERPVSQTQPAQQPAQAQPSQQPAQAQQPAGTPDPQVATVQQHVEEWKNILATKMPDCAGLNKIVGELKTVTRREVQIALWNQCIKPYAARMAYEWDSGQGAFTDAGFPL